MDIWISIALAAAAVALWYAPTRYRWAVLSVAGAVLGYLVGRRRPDELPVVEREREAARDAVERAVVADVQASEDAAAVVAEGDAERRADEVVARLTGRE